MYDLIPFIFGGMILILGLVMVINPKAATNKKLQNDENMVEKTKKSGFIEIACGIVIIIIGIIRLF